MPSILRPNTLTKQRVAPLFLVAAALIAFGWYFVFGDPQPAPAEPTQLPSPFFEPIAPPTVEPLDGAVTLAHQPAARRAFLDLRQLQSRDGHSAGTWFSLEAIDRPVAGGAETSFEVVRTYENTRIVTFADGDPTGSAVVNEVGKLIDTASQRLLIAPTGEYEASKLTSTEAAPVRTVLTLIENATRLLSVRVPREAIHAGEAWEWKSPVIDRSESDAKRARGSMRLRGEVLGRTPDGLVVVEVTAKSELRIGDTVMSRTTGKGWATWLADGSHCVSSNLKFTKTDTFEDETVTAEYLLRARYVAESE